MANDLGDVRVCNAGVFGHNRSLVTLAVEHENVARPRDFWPLCAEAEVIFQGCFRQPRRFRDRIIEPRVIHLSVDFVFVNVIVKIAGWRCNIIWGWSFSNQLRRSASWCSASVVSCSVSIVTWTAIAVMTVDA